MRFDSVCFAAAKLIEQCGWIQHRAYSHTGSCLVGAIGRAGIFQDFRSREETIVRLARYRGCEDREPEQCERFLARWNDSLPPISGKSTVIKFLLESGCRFQRETTEAGSLC